MLDTCRRNEEAEACLTSRWKRNSLVLDRDLGGVPRPPSLILPGHAGSAGSAGSSRRRPLPLYPVSCILYPVSCILYPVSRHA